VTFRGRDLVDVHGRVLQLRGINLVHKGTPFYAPLADGWLGDDDVASLLRDGHNAVRLGVWADALLPEPGVVDREYLERVADGVDRLARAGVWVLLDFHQDVFVGLPDWATTPEAAALPGLPDGLASGQLWALSYLSPRSLQQWDDLWDRVPVAGGRSAVDLLGDGVAAVAERFRNHPDVLGIDLLNEPFAGSPVVQCTLGACPERYAQVRSAQVRSATEEWTARVRAVAPRLPVWWEPFTFGPPFPGQPAPSDDLVGVTFHSYCPLVTDGGRPEQPDPASNWVCQLFSDTHVGAGRLTVVADDGVGAGRAAPPPALTLRRVHTGSCTPVSPHRCVQGPFSVLPAGGP
jgi:endoglycosylceramidase